MFLIEWKCRVGGNSSFLIAWTETLVFSGLQIQTKTSAPLGYGVCWLSNWNWLYQMFPCLGLQTKIIIHFSSDGLQLTVCKSWHLLASIIMWVNSFKSINQPTLCVLFLRRSLTDTRLATGTVQKEETFFPRMTKIIYSFLCSPFSPPLYCFPLPFPGSRNVSLL